MSFRPILSSNSQATNNNQINNMIRELNSRERIQIFKDDSGTRRVQIGKGANGFYGLKTSPEGVDVYTASDADLTFNSDKSFTVIESGTVTFPSQSVTSASPLVFATSFVIPHNAGRKPGFACFAPLFVGSTSGFPPDFPSNQLWAPVYNQSFIFEDPIGFMTVYMGVDDTNLYIGMSYTNQTAGTVVFSGAPVTYYIYTSRAVLT